MIKLAFGAHWLVPKAVTTAWGARWIFPDDMLWDRQGSDGPDFPNLRNWLNSGPIKAAKVAAAMAAKRYTITPDSIDEYVLFSDPAGVIVGTPNRSYGYLYVAGWLHNGDPDKQAKCPHIAPGTSKSVDARKELKKRSSRVNEALRRSRQ